MARQLDHTFTNLNYHKQFRLYRKLAWMYLCDLNLGDLIELVSKLQQGRGAKRPEPKELSSG